MKLPSFRRIITSDFDKQFKDLIENLGSTINDSFNVVYSALNKRLTLTDNIMCTFKQINVQVDSNGDLVSPITIKLDVQNTTVKTVIAGTPQNLTNPSIYASGAPSVSYAQNGDQLRILNIKGLQANYIWSLYIIAIN